MKSVPQKVEGPRFLSGWKEIASYLGKGVRTVQRYERELGFPVRRPAGKSHAAVIATKAEVDAWVAASPIREQFRLPRVQINSQMVTLDDLKKRMETMGALRDQMAALRKELRESVRGLAHSIEGIHGEIDNRWAGGRKLPLLFGGRTH
jgi:predicted DNA-binding transcriptional regulator AlpA